MTQLSLQEALALGMRHHNAGELAQAEAIYRRILQQSPNQPDALHLLGVIAHQVRRYDVAIQLIGAAINAGLQTPATFNNIGEAYRHSRQFEQAEACYRQAIRRDPKSPGTHSNLGIVLHDQGKLEEAVHAFQEALRCDPNLVEALNNYANLLLTQGKLADAETMLRRAIEIRPGYAEAHNNLATSLERSDRFDEAEAEYRRAIELFPDFVEAIVNLGSVYQKNAQASRAIEQWEKALAMRPDHADAKWNIGLGALAQGNYRTGWALYEARFQCNHSRQYWREYPQPRWAGADISGKTILLYPEQGFGDVIQFARFASRVGARGAKVILECHAELVEVMKSVPGVTQVVASAAALPSFHTYLALLSVPSVLGIELDDLHGSVPYLSASPLKRETWAARLAAPDGVKRIGIVWSGKPIPDPKRTCPIDHLKPLFEIENTRWFSLQTGDARERLATLPDAIRLNDLGGDLRDFSDTAAMLSHLDLLITIDTATAHLAGAMGVNTWTMIPFAPDWRWMYGREDSPWYPTMRLFRQPKINDWKSIVARIRDELVTFASA